MGLTSFEIEYQPRPQGHLCLILLEMDRDTRSDPGGHRKVLPFDWLTGKQKIFVNYYDFAASIRSQPPK